LASNSKHWPRRPYEAFPGGTFQQQVAGTRRLRISPRLLIAQFLAARSTTTPGSSCCLAGIRKPRADGASPELGNCGTDSNRAHLSSSPCSWCCCRWSAALADRLSKRTSSSHQSVEVFIHERRHRRTLAEPHRRHSPLTFMRDGRAQRALRPVEYGILPELIRMNVRRRQRPVGM